MEYVVTIAWDGEANVWTASSDDVKGLVLEAGSIDALMERVRHAGPELLTLNKQNTEDRTVLHFYIEKSERMYA